MTTHKVGYFVGSLAKASTNRKLAGALVHLAPPELQMSEIPFGNLPLYSYDYDADFPPASRTFKDAISKTSKICFSSSRVNLRRTPAHRPPPSSTATTPK
jgi:chromate reductase